MTTTGQQPSYPPSHPFPRETYIKPLLIIFLESNYCLSLRFLQSANSRQRAGSLPSISGFSFSISATWAQKRQLQENPKSCTYKCCADRQEGWFWKLVLVPNLSSFHLERSQAAAPVMIVLMALTMCSKTELWGEGESFQESFHKQTKDHIAVLDWKEVISLTLMVRLVLLLKPL